MIGWLTGHCAVCQMDLQEDLKEELKMNQNKDVMVANAIIEAIGGKENIRAVGHCSSRLRLTLNDKK